MKQLLLSFLACALSSAAFSQGVFETSGGGSDWDDATSWTLISGSDADGIPDADDDVRITAGNTIEVTTTESCASLRIDDDSSLTEFLIDGGETLTVTGNVSINVDASFAEIYLDIDGTLVVGGTFRVLVDEADAAVEMTIGTTGVLDINGAGTSFFRVMTAVSSLSFFDNLGTVTCDGNFEFRAADASELIVDNTGSFSTEGDFRMRIDRLNSTLDFQNKGTLDVNTDIDLRARSGALQADLLFDQRYNGSETRLFRALNQLNSGGTVDAGTQDAEFIYDGTAGQTVLGQTAIQYHDLTIACTDTATLSGTFSTAELIGDLTINASCAFKDDGNSIQGGEDVINNGHYRQTGESSYAGNYSLNNGASHELRNIFSVSGNFTSTGTGAVTINNGGALEITGDYTNGGSVETVGTGGSISVGGDFIHTGSLTMLDADVFTMNGTAGTSTMSGTVTFPNLTINHSGIGVTNTGNISITEILNIDNGTFTTGGAVTLISDANGTAQFDDLTGGAISGSMTVQRRIVCANDNWREITSPVQSTVIDDWQPDLITSGFPNSGFPAFPFVSVYTYNENDANGDKDNGWFEAQDAQADATGPDAGHRIYIGVGTHNVSVTGEPYTGTQTFNLDFQDDAGSADEEGWNLIGNPYPCTIDWDNLSVADRTNIENSIWIFSGDAGNYGVYVGGTGGTGTNGVGQFIPHTNAFWVHATASGPQLIINEADKAADEDQTFVKSTLTEINDLLYVKVTGDVNNYRDEAVLKIADNASPGYAMNEDAYKLYTNQDLIDYVPSMSWVVDNNTELSISKVDRQENYSLPLKVLVGDFVQGNYTLEFSNLENFMPGSCLQLEDLHTGYMTDLRTSNGQYTYLSTDTTTTARFVLHVTTSVTANKTDASCYGFADGIAVTEVSPGSNVDLQWLDASGNVLQTSTNVTLSDTLHNVAAGLYTVHPVGGICLAGDVTVEVEEPTQVLAEFTASADTIYLSDGGEIDFSNLSTGANAYFWDFDDNNTSSSFEPMHTYQNVGVYNVTLNASNGNAQCDHSISLPVTVQESASVGINDLAQNQSTFVFQNADGVHLSFNFDAIEDVTIEVLDAQGKKIAPLQRVQASQQTIALPMLAEAQGVYFVTVRSEENTWTNKVVLNR